MEIMNIKKLLSDFTDQQSAYSEQVDKLFKGDYRDSNKCFRCSVNAVESVIIPLFKTLKEHFSRLQLPDKDRYGLAGGFYKMTIGGRIIGGFSYPRKGESFLLYTPFTGNSGNKGNYKIFCLQQIVRIIRKQLN